MKAGYAQNKAGYSGCYLPGVGIPGLYGLRRLLTVAVFLLLGACQSDEQEQNLYFPLENDWRWQYRVTEDLIDQQNERTFVIENRGLAEFQWPDNDPGPVYIRRTSDGTDYYFSRMKPGYIVLHDVLLLNISPDLIARRVWCFRLLLIPIAVSSGIWKPGLMRYARAE